MNESVQDQPVKPVIQPQQSQAVPEQQSPVSSDTPSTFVTTPPKKRPYWILAVFGLAAIVLVVIIVVIRVQGETGQKPAALPSPLPTQAPSPTPPQKSGFDVDSLNEDRWNAWFFGKESSVKQKGEKIFVETSVGATATTAAIVASKTVVKGDFEASVDVEIVQGAENAETAFVFHDEAEGWPNSIAIHLNKELDDSVTIRAIHVLAGQPSELAAESRTDNKLFSLRLIRSDDAVTFVVDEVTIAQTTGFFQGDGRISLSVESREPDFPQVLSTFDNFSLNF